MIVYGQPAPFGSAVEELIIEQVSDLMNETRQIRSYSGTIATASISSSMPSPNPAWTSVAAGGASMLR